jgi:hypothetical protein
MHRIIRWAYAAGLLGVALTAACGDGTGPGPGPDPTGVPGVTVIASPATSDTIEAIASEVLTLEIRDAQGRLVRNGAVSFLALNRPPGSLCSPAPACPGGPGMRFSAVDGGNWVAQQSRQTDGSGRVSLRLRFGTTSGASHVAVSAAGGVADTLEFTVRPGAPTSFVLMPADTVIYLNESATLRPEGADRYWNPTTEVATLTSTLGVLGNVVTGTAYGEHRVRASLRGLSTERTVVVMPRGTIAMLLNLRGNQVRLLDLNGSNPRLIDLGINVGVAGMDWTPDGSALVVALGGSFGHAFPPRSLRRVTMDGAMTPFLATGPADAVGPRFTADGQWLYFTGGTGDSDSRVMRTRADGSGLEVITNIPRAEIVAASPDGQRIAWAAHRSGAPLHVYDVATGTSTPVGVEAKLAAWSPAAQRLAYASDGQLGFVAPDGSGNQVINGLTVSTWDWGGLDWSPDGEWVVYSDGQVRIRQVSTGLTMRVPNASGVSPVWK